ncbi:hypothetical protein ACN38_g5733 [Penicillium nordicum]|uniref:Uncharacterized protein n=1 Tax=Penicillium nordicum TaxID=229535 RepID=A0A0M9WFX2_9EURO|nr:hypothetical protein ACN38_g5733 [Penicillium nordicum]
MRLGTISNGIMEHSAGTSVEPSMLLTAFFKVRSNVRFYHDDQIFTVIGADLCLPIKFGKLKAHAITVRVATGI